MKDFLDPPDSVTAPGIPDAPANGVVAVALAQFPTSQLSEIEIPMQLTDAWQFHFFHTVSSMSATQSSCLLIADLEGS